MTDDNKGIPKTKIPLENRCKYVKTVKDYLEDKLKYIHGKNKSNKNENHKIYKNDEGEIVKE